MHYVPLTISQLWFIYGGLVPNRLSLHTELQPLNRQDVIKVDRFAARVFVVINGSSSRDDNV